jgi:hypothetical protein
VADVLVINHHQARLDVSNKVSAKGVTSTKSKIVMTTTTTSSPITVMLDEGAVAKRAAEVFARTIREQTKAISASVKASTAETRRTVEKAFFKGKPWALKRFSGGRTGITPPTVGGNQKFNHSGRLADSIVAMFRKATKDWAINFAANRWNPANFRSLAAMQEAFRQWVALVPVLQDASSDLGIQRAIRDTFADILQQQAMGADHKSAINRGKAFLSRFKSAANVLNDTTMTEDDEQEVAS